MNNNLLNILVAEDTDDDRQILQFAFNAAGIKNPLCFVSDGEEVLEYLKSSKNVSQAGIIMLDLNMPKMGGLETLQIIKEHDEWKKIPVIIFSASEYAGDINSSYLQGAASYIVKPLSYSKLINILKALKAYWLDSTVLPLLK